VTTPAAQWIAGEKQRIVSVAFFLIIGVSIGRKFLRLTAGRAAFGYRRAIAAMYLGFFVAMAGTFAVARPWPRSSGSGFRWWLLLGRLRSLHDVSARRSFPRF
jgi:hypothetical protein